MDQNLAIQFSQLDTWASYAKYVHRYTGKLNAPVFRGQGNDFRHAGCSGFGWQLEPSLYRNRNKSHPEFICYVNSVLLDAQCQDEIEKIVGRNLNKDIDGDRDLLIGLMRHLGFPTPLLDWTKNPFVAAFFAFNEIHHGTDKVSIFLFDQESWQKNENSLTSRDLSIVKLRELGHLIPRQNVQDSIYTYSRNERVYSELLGDEFEGNEYFLACCNLPIRDREDALNCLGTMQISFNHLFPDEDQVQKLKKTLYALIRDRLDLKPST